MDEQNLILEAAKKYGFNLEFKVARSLNEYGYEIELNKPLEQVEVDIVASNTVPGLHILIESKGASENAKLILIKAPDNILQQHRAKTISYRYPLKNEFQMKTFSFKSENHVFCTFTGDFFILKNKKDYIRCSKNDEKNNFFKAQEQICLAIKEYINIEVPNPEHDERTLILLPLIVTNADIWAIDFNLETPTSENHKWVLHNTKNIGLELKDKTGSNVKYFMLPVVNSKYIIEFLEHINKANRNSDYNLPSGKIT